MPISDTVWWSVLGVAVVAYGVSAALVLAQRLAYRRRRRVLRWLERRIRDVRARPRDEWREHTALIFERLARARVGTLLRIATELEPSKAALTLLLESVASRSDPRALIELATTERNDWRRIQALRVLATTRREQDAWTCIAHALATGSPEVKSAAASLLAHIPDRRAAQLLVRGLQQGHLSGSRIATSLQAFPLEVPDLIEPLLSSDDDAVRYWGTVLSRRHHTNTRIGATLATLVDDPSPVVRKAALETLGAVGDERGIAVARAKLTDPVPYVRAHAARALGAMRGLVAASAVARLLADREWVVRAAAKRSLEAMGPGAAPVLFPVLTHQDRFAREGAAEILAAMGVRLDRRAV